ncbi:MAG TPA: tetratricopeptide repeat protein [Bacteroidia bacterium]|nr:tetratricopeptide repeat protein [Bacteroidia bacterium]
MLGPLTVLLLFFGTLTATATVFEMNTTCREAYTNIQLLQFNKARELISLERKAHAGNAAVVYLEGYIDFLTAFVTEEDTCFEKQKKSLDSRLQLLNKVAPANPWVRMAGAELIMQTAINKLKWQEFLSAGYLFRKSYKMLEENQKQYPDFYPNLKALGFCHTAIGSVPSNYQWLANLAGMKGSVKQGAAELDLLLYRIKNDPELNFLETETEFIRAFVAIHFEKNNTTALQIANRFEHAKYNGPLQLFLTANVYVLTGDPQKGLAILENAAPSPGTLKMDYLDYMKGSLKIEKLDYNAAADLGAFTGSFKGRSFIKAAWQKMGWIRLLQGDTTGYTACMRQVTLHGNNFTDEDKQATVEAESGSIPNIILLRARLLTDGGNYGDALAVIASQPASIYHTTHEQLELTYRLARIYDKMGNTAKALEYYQLTCTNGASRPYYFAANSALLTAVIYEQQGNREKAIEWYKKCLSMRNHEYQNSIDQKAKSGLDRLG